MSEQEREFICTIPGSTHEEPVYAATRSKARYRYWLQVSEPCPDLRLIEVRVRAGAKPSPPSTEWKTLGLTERQRHIARHALGFDGRHKESYRNHYVIGPRGDTYDDWMDLVKKGLATHHEGGVISGGSDVFHCTKQLALSVRGSYEHLERDFKE